MRCNHVDDRMEEVVGILRDNGPCTYAYIRERVTKPARGLWDQMLNDKRVLRTRVEGVRCWKIRD